jgi:hypothetical protein
MVESESGWADSGKPVVSFVWNGATIGIETYIHTYIQEECCKPMTTGTMFKFHM